MLSDKILSQALTKIKYSQHFSQTLSEQEQKKVEEVTHEENLQRGFLTSIACLAYYSITLVYSFAVSAELGTFAIIAGLLLTAMFLGTICLYQKFMDLSTQQQMIVFFLFWELNALLSSLFMLTSKSNMQMCMDLFIVIVMVVVVPLCHFIYRLTFSLFPLGCMIYAMAQNDMSYLEYVLIIAFVLMLFLLAYMDYKNFVHNITTTSRIQDYSRVIQTQIDNEASHYRQVEEVNSELRRFRHDMNNHFIAIRELIQKRDTGQAMDYIDNLTTKVNVGASMYDTGNPVLDSILSRKKQEAKKYGITCEFEIMVPSSLSIEALDVCAIWGNLLDNAIEACRKSNVPNPIIRCSIMFRKSYMVCKIENTATAKLQRSENSYTTTKDNKNLHGIGLKSAQTSIEKYDGELKCSHEEGIFTSSFILCNVEPEDMEEQILEQRRQQQKASAS